MTSLWQAAQTALDADCRLYVYLHSRARAERLDPLMVAVTTAGTKGAVWFAVAALLLVLHPPEARRAAVLSLAALLVAEGIINFILKPLFRRERPYQRGIHRRLLVDEPGPNSLPSAHAGSSIAAGLILSALYFPWGLLFLALACLIAYSRVYVGVHYPLDILAGGAVGAAAAVLTALLAPLLSALTG
jgi:undecaprenyl-diphosphatase